MFTLHPDCGGWIRELRLRILRSAKGVGVGVGVGEGLTVGVGVGEGITVGVAVGDGLAVGAATDTTSGALDAAGAGTSIGSVASTVVCMQPAHKNGAVIRLTSR